ncbi:MAG: hypothetical protein KGQ67_07440 [Betaproteobacteria bacterium]|nr:hypothetical protein [Betaproteobacteria bacterium]
MNPGRRALQRRAAAPLLAMLLVLTGCAAPPGLAPGPSPLDPRTVLPTTARAVAPAQVEAALDLAWRRLQGRALAADAAGRARIAGVARRLAGAAPSSEPAWREAEPVVLIVPGDEPDAWCLAPLRCALTLGMSELLGGDDALLAAALAHEMAHLMLDQARERLAQAGAPDPAAGATLLLESAHHRVHEHEVFGLAAELMARAGYDPRASVGFFAALAPAPGVAPVGYLRRHPLEPQWPDVLLRHARRVLPLLP